MPAKTVPSPRALANSPRPNVLFITVDQWRGDMGPGQKAAVPTPHLDALCNNATCFTRHYTQAYPCGPARAGLLTGLYPHKHRVIQNGSPLDAQYRTLAQAARHSGYRPVLFGYTDTQADPRTLEPTDPAWADEEGIAPGFDVQCLLTARAQPWIADLIKKGYPIANPKAGRDGIYQMAPFGTSTCIKAEDSETAFLTAQVLDHLSANTQQPFFIHLSYIAPHPPFAAAKEWLAKVSVPDANKRENRPSHSEAIRHPLIAFHHRTQNLSSFAPNISGPVHTASEQTQTAIRHAYGALMAEVDHHIGQLVARLKTLDLWENTIIVISGDHGEQMFDHDLLGKVGWHDAAAHVPLIMRVPGTKPGQSIDHFTQSIDLFPTLVQLLRLEPDVNLDGKSLVPFLNGLPPSDWRDCVFWSHDFRNLANLKAEQHFGLPSRLCNFHVVRTKTFKYVHFPTLPPVVHDLSNDPGEHLNIAESDKGLALRYEGLERLFNMRISYENEMLSCLQAQNDHLHGNRQCWEFHTFPQD
ncbi:sulfatase-like hydrolase/transferase [Thalassospira sp. TSL5-1]|uniref:sulfatase-like hydrolase/transferase n=1 Tax=Thalassospira sp. TSL5-1 TaxID=1544451 RepID=UPI001439691B|nr:sulfatase-like hydrolase/transferase [Thalassospira sp. TSL5-1]